jgi:uncharacterized protein
MDENEGTSMLSKAVQGEIMVRLASSALLLILVGCEVERQPVQSAADRSAKSSSGDSNSDRVGAAISEDLRAVNPAPSVPPRVSEPAVRKANPPTTPDVRPEDATAKEKLAAALAWSHSLEHSLLFAPTKFPDGEWQPVGLEFEDVRFTASDETRLHGWFVPCDMPRAAVLFAHGNGSNITHRAEMLRALHDRMHVAVMIFDYRGYGRSDGSPDEAGILADARAARTWLAKRAAVKENEIVLFGESLGGAVAVDLAVDGARGLVLDSTFNSLPDVAAWHFPWLPVDALLQTRLDSAAKIGKYHGPLLEVHGDRDQTVPIQFGRRLFAAANEPKQFVVMPGVDHNDRRPREFFRALDRFIGALK